MQVISRWHWLVVVVLCALFVCVDWVIDWWMDRPIAINSFFWASEQTLRIDCRMVSNGTPPGARLLKETVTVRRIWLARRPFHQQMQVHVVNPSTQMHPYVDQGATRHGGPTVCNTCLQTRILADVIWINLHRDFGIHIFLFLPGSWTHALSLEPRGPMAYPMTINFL